MKCPYCAEEIRDDASKCKHCNEWLPSATLIYPSETTMVNANIRYSISVEGRKYHIERLGSKEIQITNDSGEQIALVSQSESHKVTTIDIGGHSIEVSYRDIPGFLQPFFWFAGFRITVDGRPLAKSASDPYDKIRMARIASFIFAAIYFLGLFKNSESIVKVVSGMFLVGFVGVGLLASKLPISALLPTSLWCIFEVWEYTKNVVTNYAGRMDVWLIFGFLVRAGATFALIQGTIAGFHLVSLKRKMRTTRNA